MFANVRRDGQYGHEQSVGGSCNIVLTEAPPVVGSWMCGANAESDGKLKIISQIYLMSLWQRKWK